MQKTGHPFYDTQSPEFSEILEIYNQCLAENRGSGRLIREVYTYVDIAQLYFHAAVRLDDTAIEPFLQAMEKALAALEKIRDGWRALRGGYYLLCKFLSCSECFSSSICFKTCSLD